MGSNGTDNIDMITWAMDVTATLKSTFANRQSGEYTGATCKWDKDG